MSDSVLIEKLNVLVADSLIVSVKLHSRRAVLHSGFELIGKLYNYFLHQYEDLVARIIQLGGTPIDTVEDALNAASLRNETHLRDDDFSSVLSDFERMKTAALSAAAVADPVTENKLRNFVADLDRAIWTSIMTWKDHEHYVS